jgi:hypothetical protein
MPPRPNPRPKRPTIEDILALRNEADATATEVLDHVYQALLKAPEFTLKDGRTARVEEFYAPEVDEHGELKCGIDVKPSDGSHLEVTVGHTGWGKSFVGDLQQRAKPKSSHMEP